MNFKDYVFLLLLSLFSAFVTSYAFFKTGTLYWDSGLFFSIFRDNLHSLNEFGEFPWWYPHKQLGWPSYYYSILGQLSASSPVAVLLGALSWLLGQCGISLTSYQPWMLIQVGFLSPLLVNSAVFIFSRQLFHDKSVSYYATILAAFSPAVVFNLSDPGFLEPAAYSLFLAAGYLNFVRQPSRSAFFLFTLTCCLIAINLNFPFMFWNVIAIPLFLGAVLLFSRSAVSGLKTALHSVSIMDYGLAILAIAICASPSLLVFSQAGDLIRSRMGQKTYDFTSLFPGNPLEMVSVGWPGFGFDLDGKFWRMRAPGPDHLGLTYMGLLCLPLTLVGLVSGRRNVRNALFFMIVVAFGVICLSAYSPFFATLLIWDTPFRTNNHYGDALFRSGSYLLLIFGAALGLDTVLRIGTRARKLLRNAFAIWIALSTVMMVFILGGVSLDPKTGVFVLGDGVSKEPNMGIFVAMAIFFFVLLLGFVQAKSRKTVQSLTTALLVLSFVDVATVVNLHVRKMSTSLSLRKIDETPAPDRIGLQVNFPGDYASSILVYRPLYEMQSAGFDPAQLPYLRAFTAARISLSVVDDVAAFHGTAPKLEALALDGAGSESPDIYPFMTQTPRPVQAQAALGERSYNEFSLRVKTDQPSLIFVRDAYSPYWTATSEQGGLSIARALRNFKAVAVPAGETEIKFRFQPPFIKAALILAYAVLLLLAGFLLTAKLRKGLRP